MKLELKSKNLDFTLAIKEYIEMKIGGLAKLVSGIERGGTEVLARVEVVRTSNHHGKGDVYRAEVNIDAPQNIVRAEEESTNIRAAIDGVQVKLRQLLVKYKEKRSD